MTGILKVLSDSFNALRKFPKLFLPKLLIAGLYGSAMLLVAGLFKQLMPLIQDRQASLANPELLESIGSQAWQLLAFLVFVLVLDVLFNAAYSVMVKDFLKNGRVSIIGSLKTAFGKFFVVVPAVLSSLLVFLVFAFPIAVAASFSLIVGDLGLLLLSILLILLLELALTVVFFSIYPVSVFEKHGFFGVLKNSAGISRRKFRQVFPLSVFSLLLSACGIVFAFLARDPAFLALFVFFRFLTALLATYQIILNPVFYLEFVKKAGA